MSIANQANTLPMRPLSTASKQFIRTLFSLTFIVLASCGNGTAKDNASANATLTDANTQQIQTADKTVTAVLETSAGTIVLALNASKAPASVENFVQYINDGFYDGTIFHRVIDGFMIQGGGFDASMVQKATRATIANEADNGLPNATGTIAMARTNAPHSATSQFFINVKDNRALNHTGKHAAGWGYAVFGAVTEGMDVINAIKGAATKPKMGHGNVPTEAITITKAYIR